MLWEAATSDKAPDSPNPAPSGGGKKSRTENGEPRMGLLQFSVLGSPFSVRHLFDVRVGLNIALLAFSSPPH
jgi:hypothetical protein